jgi:hypothetical protein
MANAQTTAQNVQNEILSTIRQSQEAVLDAIRAWTQTVESITPKLPAMNAPFGDKLPKPEEVVANAYDFAEQLLANQRTFAEEVVKATAPLRPGTEQAP